MAITPTSYITVFTLVISIISITLVIISTVVQRRSKPEHHSDGNDLEVSAVVSEFGQRMKRLEENLVDQRVKLEILDLRLGRIGSVSKETYYEGDKRESVKTNLDRPAPYTIMPSPVVAPKSPSEGRMVEKRGGGVGSTELEVLRIVQESQGKATAKEIQGRIGRTREHTARMMNMLFKNGLVQRDITIRPFSYSITQKGRDLLRS